MTQLTDPATLPAPPVVRMPFLRLARTVREFHTAVVLFRDTVGPVSMTRLGPLTPPLVWVATPQGAHDVLAPHSASLDKTNSVAVQTRLVAGDSVFTLSHAPWRSRRRLLQPLFTKKHVAGFTGHMAAAAQAVADGWEPGSVVDIDAQTRRLTLRVLGRSLFGIDLDEQADRLAEPARTVLSYATSRITSPVRLPLWLPTPQQRRWRAARAVVQEVIDDAIEQARTHPGRAELLDLLLEARDPMTGLALTHEEIRSELTTFLLAGHDPTSTTLTYALWQLGRNPDLQYGVAAEARAVGDRELTVADIPALPLTVRVLHEALRLCPPAAAVARRAEEDVAVDGHRVEAGWEVMVSIWALHRDPALWGAAAEEFDPDRFLPDRSTGRDRWAFLPFGGGVRSCIGDHFAMAEAAIALATLVRAVDFDSLEEDFPVALPFTLTAAGPVPVRVQPRDRLADVHRMTTEEGEDRTHLAGVRSSVSGTPARHRQGGAIV
jgi:cytochrome P450